MLKYNTLEMEQNMVWKRNLAISTISIILTVIMCINIFGCNNCFSIVKNNRISDKIISDEIIPDGIIPDEIIKDNIIHDEYNYECKINDSIICDVVLIDVVVGEKTKKDIKAQLPEEYKSYDINWAKVIGKYAIGTSIIIAVGFVDCVTQGRAAIAFGTPATIGKDAFAGAVIGAAVNTSIKCLKKGKPTKKKLKKSVIEGSADGYMWGAITSLTKNIVHNKKLVLEDGTKLKIQKNGNVIDKKGKFVGKAYAKGDKIYVVDKRSRVTAVFNSSGKYIPEPSNSLPKNSIFQSKDGLKKQYTDAKGIIYREGDELRKDISYTKNGYNYSTDNYKRIKTFSTNNLKMKDGQRLNITDSQKTISQGAQKADDDRGHLFGDMFGGDNSMANIVPMKKELNRGEYKKMEEEWNAALKEGKKVRVTGKLIYKDTTKRPSKLKVTYTIDNSREVERIFIN